MLEPLIGAVLAGGLSSRMGREKATVEVAGKPMASHVVAAMGAAGAQIVVLAGGDPAVASLLDLELLPDIQPGQGPLGGLLTSMSRGELVMTAPCDVPYVSPRDLAALVQFISTSHDVDVVCLSGPAGPEPLIAVWRSDRCAEVIRRRLDAGRRSAFGLLSVLSVAEIEVADPATLCNVNEMSDLHDE